LDIPQGIKYLLNNNQATTSFFARIYLPDSYAFIKTSAKKAVFCSRSVPYRHSRPGTGPDQWDSI
jgi:hypothetical protein